MTTRIDSPPAGQAQSRGRRALAGLRRPRNLLFGLAGLVGLLVVAAIVVRLWQMHEDAAAASEAVAAIQSFDPTKPGSIHRLNAAAVERSGVVSAVGPYLRDSNLDRRFAAIYIVELVAQNNQDARILSTALSDPNLGYRVIAAGSLAGLGDVRSIPVLIEGLASPASLPYDDPPRQLADLAKEALEAYTGKHFPDLLGWRSWWEAVKDRLHWNGTAYVT